MQIYPNVSKHIHIFVQTNMFSLLGLSDICLGKRPPETDKQNTSDMVSYQFVVSICLKIYQNITCLMTTSYRFNLGLTLIDSLDTMLVSIIIRIMLEWTTIEKSERFWSEPRFIVVTAGDEPEGGVQGGAGLGEGEPQL